MTCASTGLFAPLPVVPGGFACIAADPPWRFASNSDAKPGRNARRHYRTLALSEIATLPVGDIAARDAFLWLWIPSPFLVVGAHIGLMRGWGFEPTALAFTWAKLNPNAPTLLFSERDFAIGGGLTTRKNTETVVLGRCGKPKRLAKDVRELILAPRREHSRKPDEFYRRAERYCAGPRLDLFAREHRSGWTCWGDELPPLLGNSFSEPLGRSRTALETAGVSSDAAAFTQASRQFDPGLITVGERDAGLFQGGANGGEIVDQGQAPPLLEVPDRAFAEVGERGQLGLRPAQKGACGAGLLGRYRH
jgi:N6-adenosine-specific RNA methylase IME4